MEGIKLSFHGRCPFRKLRGNSEGRGFGLKIIWFGFSGGEMKEFRLGDTTLRTGGHRMGIGNGKGRRRKRIEIRFSFGLKRWTDGLNRQYGYGLGMGFGLERWAYSKCGLWIKIWQRRLREWAFREWALG